MNFAASRNASSIRGVWRPPLSASFPGREDKGGESALARTSKKRRPRHYGSRSPLSLLLSPLSPHPVSNWLGNRARASSSSSPPRLASSHAQWPSFVMRVSFSSFHPPPHNYPSFLLCRPPPPEGPADADIPLAASRTKPSGNTAGLTRLAPPASSPSPPFPLPRLPLSPPAPPHSEKNFGHAAPISRFLPKELRHS